MSGYEFCSATGTWAGALATFVAVVVALFKGVIHRWLFPVKVHLEWQDCAPYAQIVSARTGMSRPEEVMFRLKLINHGKDEAKDVQVLIDNLERVQPRGGNWIDDALPWQPSPSFVPVSLKWTHLNQPRLDFLPIESSRYVDFGLWQGSQTSPHPTLNLSTEVELRMNGSKLKAGEYRCQIVVTDRSGVLHKAWWSFEFKDEYRPPAEDHELSFIGFRLKMDKVLVGDPPVNTLRRCDCSNCQ
ncbi:MAG: hypothetical protein ABL974_15980 [Prosthecobacter sp.]